MATLEWLTTCEYSFEGPFLEYAISLPLFMILQLSLLIISIYYETIIHRNRSFKQIIQIPFKSRFLYILLQCIGLCWTITDLFRKIIDPHIGIMSNNYNELDHSNITLCEIIAYIPKAIPVPYYVVYLYQILLRIQSAFQGSYLELSKRTLYLLHALILIPIISFAIFIYFNRDSSICIHHWSPIDMELIRDWFGWTKDAESFGYCDFPLNDSSIVAYGIGLAWIPILNIIFGIIFCVKLNQLLSRTNSKLDDELGHNQEIKFQTKSIIVKIAILTLTGSISTTLAYLCYLLFSISAFLYMVCCIDIYTYFG